MPNSPESEASILGIILFDPKERLDPCMEALSEEDFYTRSNALIFRSLKEMSESGVQIDVITLTGHLKTAGILAEIGGAYYVSSLTHGQFISSNLEEYIETVKQKAKIRALISLSHEIISQGPLCDDAQELTIKMEARLLALKQGAGSKDNLLQSAADKVFEMVQKRKSGEKVQGCATGLAPFDKIFGGLQRSQMYVLGARPSTGKTSYADQITMNLIMRDQAVLFIGLEASSERILAKMACKAADVIYWDFIRNALRPEDLQRVENVIAVLRKKPLVLLRPPSLGAAGIRATILSYARQFDLQLIVLDFIQRVEIPKGQDERRAVGDASKALANASVETGVPCLVLAQLNRTSESEARPRMRHLKETGQLEEDADNVLLLWSKDEAEKPLQQEVIMSIEKNKDGASGFDEALIFDRPKMKFRGKEILFQK